MAGCLPALSEAGDLSAGAGGETVGGNGGSAGKLPTAGRPGVAGAGVASSKGGGGGSPWNGGDAGRTGNSPSAGGESDAGASEGGASGASEGGAGGTTPAPDQSAIEAQTIERWNAIADHRDGDAYHFHWVHDMFPHPTFAAMGEAQGYREFAVVLDEFLGANFDFLAEQRQFVTQYYYVTASPADVDLEVTWDELATDFSTSDYGDTPAAVQARLAGYATNMKDYE